MGRAVLGVVVAWVLWSMLWVGMSASAQAAFPDLIDPSQRLEHVGVLVGYVVWSAVISVLAGFVCARIGERSAMKAVWSLAVIQLLIGTGVQASSWSLLPVWYHVAFLGLLIPMTVLGGVLGARGTPRTA